MYLKRLVDIKKVEFDHMAKLGIEFQFFNLLQEKQMQLKSQNYIADATYATYERNDQVFKVAISILDIHGSNLD